METTKETKLPDTLWELAELALADLEKVEQQPDKYKVDMSVWYKTNGKCKVCMAGAVLAKTLGHEIDDELSTNLFISTFNNEEGDKLDAIDDLRKGNVQAAYASIHGEYLSEIADMDRHISPYELNPNKFKEQFRNLIKDLKQEQI